MPLRFHAPKRDSVVAAVWELPDQVLATGPPHWPVQVVAHAGLGCLLGHIRVVLVAQANPDLDG